MNEWIRQRHFGEEKIDFHFDKNTISAPQQFGDIYVYQIGRMYCTRGQVIPEHVHSHWFELTILTEGRCLISAQGKECPLNEGEIFLSFPDETHAMRTEKNCEVKYDFWAFYPADDQTERKFLSLISACPSPEQRVFSDEHINTLNFLPIPKRSLPVFIGRYSVTSFAILTAGSERVFSEAVWHNRSAFVR